MVEDRTEELYDVVIRRNLCGKEADLGLEDQSVLFSVVLCIWKNKKALKIGRGVANCDAIKTSRHFDLQYAIETSAINGGKYIPKIKR